MTRIHSFSLRLALTYLGLFLTSLGLLLGSYYTFSVILPERALKAQIGREARRLEQVYAIGGEQGLVTALDARAGRRGTRSAFHVFLGPDGNARTANIPTWPHDTGPDWLTLEADLYVDGNEYDRLALMLETRFANGARLLVGRDTEDIEERKDNLEGAGLWFAASAVILGLAGGLLISRAIGKRIDRISGAAIQVMNGDLAGRVPVDGSNDDFDRLSGTLNRMLDRIADLLSSIRRVSDNVAHELRTPLARLMADVEQLEMQLSGEDNPLVGKIGDEARRLQRIFDSLLRISRIEAGRHELALVSIDPRAFLNDLSELYGPAVEAAGGSLTIAEATSRPVWADRDLLFQALANLLDNALKYGGREPQIVLSARLEQDAVRFEISDTAGELDAEEVARASERFFRGENAAGKPGEGLGLAVVKAIAEAHGGQFEFVSSSKGSRVSVSIRDERERAHG